MPPTTRRRVRLHSVTLGLEATSLIFEACANADVQALRDLIVAQERLRELEVALVALLSDSGVSWDTMAVESGVTRQSLHYRLAKRVRELLASPPQAETEVFYDRLHSLALDAAQRLDLTNLPN